VTVRVLLGQNRNVGEIGHIQVERFGRRCHCGNFGCLETIVSNAAIVERSQELLARGHASSLSSASTSLTIEQICRAANAGDALACQIIQETGEYLGRTIAIMVNLFNPEKILLAGEVVEADKILFPAIRRCVEQQSLPSFHQNLPIERAYFQGQHTMGGVALIKRALLEGDLLQRIMEM
jgi:N-acetylglucosamine repressor